MSDNLPAVAGNVGAGALDTWRPEAIAHRLGLIQETMKSVMVKGSDFDKIPGCPKPSLLQPGAQILAQLFMLSPEIVRQEWAPLGGEHFIITTTLRLRHRTTGESWGEYAASCSTRETRHLYRNAPADLEPTGKPVPKAYWNERDASLIGGKGFVAKKDDAGSWMIFKKSGDPDAKIENPNPADVHNSCQQVSFKRAYVMGVRYATGASRLFTQDVEEFMAADFEVIDVESGERHIDDAAPTPAPVEKLKPAPKPKAEPKPAAEAKQPATEQRGREYWGKRLFAIAGELSLGGKATVDGEERSVIMLPMEDLVGAARLAGLAEGVSLVTTGEAAYVVPKKMTDEQLSAFCLRLDAYKHAQQAGSDADEMFGGMER